MTNAKINEKLAMVCGWLIDRKMVVCGNEDAAFCLIDDKWRIFDPCNSLDDCKRVEDKFVVWAKLTLMRSIYADKETAWDCRILSMETGKVLGFSTDCATEPLARAKALAEVANHG